MKEIVQQYANKFGYKISLEFGYIFLRRFGYPAWSAKTYRELAKELNLI